MAEAAKAEQVYSTPSSVLDDAMSTLSSTTSTAAERAEALWVLGRAAYYANQMHDAVRLLQVAVPLVDDPAMKTEVLLTLAPALSKEGHPEEALLLLADPALEVEPKFAGQLRNQRGIILTELGRLPEAMEQMEAALPMLREAGDESREARTLVNLGAIASMMGHLDESERWYGLARHKTVATGQHVVAAGIEGNLGYVESRRGNFATALMWYSRARASFEKLGEVGLLVAVLEVDHARTLIDVGLLADAASAAENAARSASVGGNQMLETQGRLLLAEALVKLGEINAATRALRRGADLASQLGQAPWVLRAAYLASELGVEGGLGGLIEADDEIDAFLRAGWVREAYDVALQRSERVKSNNPTGARELLRRAGRLTEGLDVDPVDRALGALMLADLDDDHSAAFIEFGHALEALTEQRDLLGSVEMRTAISRRLHRIRDAALSVALRSGDQAELVLHVLERTRAIRETPAEHAGLPDEDAEQMGRLRSSRVALDEAKLNGGDVASAASEVRRVEQALLSRRRSITRSSRRSLRPKELQPIPIPADTAYVTFAVHGRRILGLTHTQESTRLVDLGPFDPVPPLVRSQLTALRHLADERRAQPDLELQKFSVVTADLQAVLIDPLDLNRFDRIVVTPAVPLGDIAWGALPSLRGRPVSIVSALGAWTAAVEAISIRRVSFLGGPGLDSSVEELEAIGRVWNQPERVVPLASCSEALRALGSADLVHIAAHGAFRADNPLFSSLVFGDGHVSLLELSELDQVPSVVVLASCDAGASRSVGRANDVVVGTATQLRHLGSEVVIAPSVAVNDAAAGELSLHLQRALATGSTFDEAMLDTRTAMINSEEPRRMAAGLAFQLFGGSATRRRPELSPAG